MENSINIPIAYLYFSAYFVFGVGFYSITKWVIGYFFENKKDDNYTKNMIELHKHRLKKERPIYSKPQFIDETKDIEFVHDSNIVEYIRKHGVQYNFLDNKKLKTYFLLPYFIDAETNQEVPKDVLKEDAKALVVKYFIDTPPKENKYLKVIF